ncbi:hypothetical protein HYFRA_00008226 [Hymenoscyphus fraxineus]|uniref:Alcohol acetyltransferase n=1 Tax=Hymenoscyphus fraxineus TaxID=746836 RepID=A0A9N9L5L1_9HELO|nr:hypothetical protein HYFRA_00008226 [Hymenoscyphus fraxineus]
MNTTTMIPTKTGLMERWHITRTHVKFYNKVLVSARYKAPLLLLSTTQEASNHKDGFKYLIYSALSEVISKHPIMSIVIEDEGSPIPKWRRVQKICFEDVVEIRSGGLRNGEDEDAWILEGHGKELERRDEMPLWRVRVTRPILGEDKDEEGMFGFTAAFYFHHAIGDGLSGNAFHLTFLSALNNLLSDPPSISNAEIIPPPKLPLIPTLEMGTKLGLTWWFVLKQIIKAFIWSPFDKLLWTGPPIKNPPVLPAVGDQKCFEIEAGMVKKLVKKCREENTSITALVTVLVARKMAIMNPTYSHFAGTIPFSLRKFTGHSERDMGNFVSNVAPLFSSAKRTERGYISCVSPEQRSDTGAYSEFKGKNLLSKDEVLWNSARETRAFMAAGTASPKNQMVGLLGFVKDLVPFFLKKFGQRREYTFEISNIGVVDGGIGAEGKERRVIFDKVLFSGSICTYAGPFEVMLATVKNGLMTVVVRWEKGVISDEDGRELARWLEEQLRGLDDV